MSPLNDTSFPNMRWVTGRTKRRRENLENHSSLSHKRVNELKMEKPTVEAKWCRSNRAKRRKLNDDPASELKKISPIINEITALLSSYAKQIDTNLVAFHHEKFNKLIKKKDRNKINRFREKFLSYKGTNEHLRRQMASITDEKNTVQQKLSKIANLFSEDSEVYRGYLQTVKALAEEGKTVKQFTAPAMKKFKEEIEKYSQRGLDPAKLTFATLAPQQLSRIGLFFPRIMKSLPDEEKMLKERLMKSYTLITSSLIEMNKNLHKDDNRLNPDISKK